MFGLDRRNLHQLYRVASRPIFSLEKLIFFEWHLNLKGERWTTWTVDRSWLHDANDRMVFINNFVTEVTCLFERTFEPSSLRAFVPSCFSHVTINHDVPLSASRTNIMKLFRFHRISYARYVYVNRWRLWLISRACIVIFCGWNAETPDRRKEYRYIRILSPRRLDMYNSYVHLLYIYALRNERKGNERFKFKQSF